jgi:hypothetical protein
MTFLFVKRKKTTEICTTPSRGGLLFLEPLEDIGSRVAAIQSRTVWKRQS